jgi:hypothetical protein
MMNVNEFYIDRWYGERAGKANEIGHSRFGLIPFRRSGKYDRFLHEWVWEKGIHLC